MICATKCAWVWCAYECFCVCVCVGVLVHRVECKGENYEMDLALDVHSQLYRLRAGNKFSLVLARTLNLDGTDSADQYDQSGVETLADKYEYVMHGMIFKTKDKGEHRELYASYGGLLMSLKGDARNLKFKEDQRIYLLLRRIEQRDL